MLGITITVERPLGRDEYGDPIDGEPERHAISGCAVAPRTTSEIDAPGRTGVIVGLTLYTPAGADLKRQDIVIIDDGDPNPGRWEVEGEPGEWRNPYTGLRAGIEVALRRAEG